MTAVVEAEVDFDVDFDFREVFSEVIDKVLESEECPYDVSVSLFITDDREIRKLNRENRGIDKETDVLSFPMLTFEKPSFFDNMEEDPDNFDPDSGELILGDIVLSMERVLIQAKEYGHSVKREYAFLLAHSLLHLLGYDHIEDPDRELMEDRQRIVMELLNINR